MGADISSLVVALAVSFYRFTIKTPHETVYVRLALVVFLGYFAFMRYEHLFLTSNHAYSYGHLIYTYVCKRDISKDHSSTATPIPNPYKETKDLTLRVVKQYNFSNSICTVSPTSNHSHYILLFLVTCNVLILKIEYINIFYIPTPSPRRTPVI